MAPSFAHALARGATGAAARALRCNTSPAALQQVAVPMLASCSTRVAWLTTGTAPVAARDMEESTGLKGAASKAIHAIEHLAHDAAEATARAAHIARDRAAHMAHDISVANKEASYSDAIKATMEDIRRSMRHGSSGPVVSAAQAEADAAAEAERAVRMAMDEAMEGASGTAEVEAAATGGNKGAADAAAQGERQSEEQEEEEEEGGSRGEGAGGKQRQGSGEGGGGRQMVQDMSPSEVPEGAPKDDPRTNINPY